jgi:sRNA-binding regulator protein Hfq
MHTTEFKGSLLLEYDGRAAAVGKRRHSSDPASLPQATARDSQTESANSKSQNMKREWRRAVAFSNLDGHGRKSFRSPFEDFRRQPKNARPARPAPPETTNAESFYYVKQMNAKTPMVIVMTDGEEVRGWIEWYDKTCLKVNRDGAPNLLIQKRYIKYLFKEEELV